MCAYAELVVQSPCSRHTSSPITMQELQTGLVISEMWHWKQTTQRVTEAYLNRLSKRICIIRNVHFKSASLGMILRDRNHKNWCWLHLSSSHTGMFCVSTVPGMHGPVCTDFLKKFSVAIPESVILFNRQMEYFPDQNLKHDGQIELLHMTGPPYGKRPCVQTASTFKH